MNKISSIETKKLENLYKQNKFNELEKETKKLLEIENDNIILLNILGVVYLKKKYLRHFLTTFSLNKEVNHHNCQLEHKFYIFDKYL